MLYSCSFLKNIYNHTTKEVNFHVFQIQYWKRWKILNPSSNFVFLLKCCYFFMLSCQKIKIRGWPCRQLVDFFLFLFFFNFQKLCCILIRTSSVCGAVVGAEVDASRSAFTLKLRQRKVLGGERPESTLSYCLSLFILSGVDHPHLW